MASAKHGSNLVSVIIPTSQRPDVAPAAIRSVLGQTYKPLEVIVIEDGSSSGIDVFIAKLDDPRIRYHRHSHQRGLAAARNTGMHLARGEYIAFLDDDDEWLPTKIEKQVQLLDGSAGATTMVYCGMTTIDRDSGAILHESRPVAQGAMKPYLLRGGLLPQSSMLLRCDDLLAVGGHSEQLSSCIDHDIWLTLAWAGFHMVPVSEPLLRTYVSAADQRMTSHLNQRLSGIGQFFDKWRPLILEQGGAEAWRAIEMIYYSQFVGRVIRRLQAGAYTGHEARHYIRAFAALQTGREASVDAWLVSLHLERLVPIGAAARRLRSGLYRSLRRHRRESTARQN